MGKTEALGTWLWLWLCRAEGRSQVTVGRWSDGAVGSVDDSSKRIV